MTQRRHISRHARLGAVALVLLVAGGCSNLITTLGLGGDVASVPPKPIGPDRLSVVLPARDARAVLGPVAQRDDIIVWQTLDGISLAFRNGVLVGTRGLGHDLMSADVSGTVAMLQGAGGGGYYPQFRSYVDGENRTVFRSYQCRRSGGDGARITETCVSPEETVENVYWLDGGGGVIGTRQWIGPELEYMETRLVVR